MTYRERRSSKRFDCSARLDSSAGLEIFRNWIVNLREPDIWTEGGQLVLSCKRICPIINRCTYKIIQLLIASVDYQCCNFSVFSGSRPSASPSKKTKARNARESTQTKIPLLSLCFHSVFMFLFVFQLKELQRVGLTQGWKRWSVLVNQSVNESEMAHYLPPGAECYGDRIQLLKAVKPGE